MGGEITGVGRGNKGNGSGGVTITLDLDAALLQFVTKEVQARKHRYLKGMKDLERRDYKRQQDKVKLARLNEFTKLAQERIG